MSMRSRFQRNVRWRLHALSLLGKFLTPNTFSVKAMKTVTQTIWKPSRGMVVKELDKNLLLFHFFLQKEKDFAFNKGPWNE